VTDNPYRDLPSVDALATSLATGLPRRIAVVVARNAIEDARRDIANGDPVDLDSLVGREMRRAESAAGLGIINATGVLLHTNLGRAPWSAEAIARAGAVAKGYSTVELDVQTGERGRRGEYVEMLLTELTGAGAALVVNNNAAAVMLALAATSSGRAVPVSRGELIEIGGSYRLPDVMVASGARLVEVGTTNRTRVGDYSTAIQTHRCGAILKVHPSNYRVEGFTEEASIGDLAAVAGDASLPLLHDLGSGLLDSGLPWLPGWLADEPGVRQSLESGADLVMFSGDKLLGGPQAGIVVGEADLVGSLRSHPLARALRVDAVTYAALGATLGAYLEGTPLEIPFWHHALAPLDDIERRAAALAREVGGTVEEGSSTVGAGSAPGASIPTALVRLESRQDLFSCLLDVERPILTRREAGDLVIDLRAVEPEDDPVIVDAINRCR
jgi:L-seryl-tRNA(Ser) seleniumtransferase